MKSIFPPNLSLPGMEAERDLSKSQWYTPPWLAEKLWAWWLHDWWRYDRPSLDHLSVLEPAAGNGSLLRPMLSGAAVPKQVHAVELDERNVDVLRALNDPWGLLEVVHHDFLTLPIYGSFDVAVMNPPYEGGRDVAFIMRALQWAPIVVGIFRSALVHGDERYQELWRYVDVVRGKWLRNRPVFGAGDGARSDFIALELVRRSEPRGVGEDMSVQMGWW